MNIRSKFLNFIVIVLFAGMTSSSCEDTDRDLSAMGKEAGTAFCDCYERNDKNYCLDKLKDKYTKAQYTSSAFISEFNNTNSCNAKLEVTYSNNISGNSGYIENIAITNH